MEKVDDEHESFTVRHPVPTLPSRELEDEVAATMLRFSKEKVLRGTRMSPVVEPTPARDRAGDDATISNAQSMPDEERENAPKDGTGTSQPGSRKRGHAKSRNVVPSSNDDLSYRILRPSAQKVLRNLDATLAILHNGRSAAATYRSESSAEETDASAELASSPRKKRRRQESTEGRTFSSKDDTEHSGRSGKRHDPIEQGTEMTFPIRAAEKGTPEQRSRKSRSRSKSRSREPLHALTEEQLRSQRVDRWELRNWRDVIAAATLAGFPPEVMARATQRCADLFGEEMKLHSLPEVPHTARREERMATASYRPGAKLALSDDEDEYEEAGNSGTDLSETKVSQDLDESSGSDIDYENIPQSSVLYFCPNPKCSRASEGFTKRSNLIRHVRDMHNRPKIDVKTESETVRQRPSSLRDVEQAANPNRSPQTTGALSEAAYFCPHPTCDRATRGFDRRNNFDRHIKTVHKGRLSSAQPSGPATPEPGNSALRKPDSTPGSRPGSRPGTPGTVHRCPFPDCPRAVDGFDRRPNLLRHVELVHKERRDVVEAVQDDDGPNSMDEMDGAVHVDRFLRPIKMRPNWLKGYDRATSTGGSRAPSEDEDEEDEGFSEMAESWSEDDEESGDEEDAGDNEEEEEEEEKDNSDDVDDGDEESQGSGEEGERMKRGRSG